MFPELIRQELKKGTYNICTDTRANVGNTQYTTQNVINAAASFYSNVSLLNKIIKPMYNQIVAYHKRKHSNAIIRAEPTEPELKRCLKSILRKCMRQIRLVP